MEGDMGEMIKYWIGFNRVHGIGPARLQGLLTAFGDIESAWNASENDLNATGLGLKYIKALIETRQTIDLEVEWKRVTDQGFSVVTWDDADYPVRLKEIPAPPPVLYVFGELVEQDRWAAGIVGTRRVTVYGRTIAQQVSSTLAANGVTIISGLARGVDGLAHEAALEVGGRTIAVLGSGLDVIYPSEHRSLAQRMAKQGAVISDYPLGTKPEAGNFPPRNRIISGLSLALIVIEAGEGSGALITADFAADQGRDVYAVPGDINRPSSRGVNQLIQAGAHPLLSADEVLEAMNMDVILRQETADRELPEDETERTIMEALTGEPIHVDELGLRCDIPVAQLTASLAMLELKGRARQVGGMQYIKVRESRVDYTIG